MRSSIDLTTNENIEVHVYSVRDKYEILFVDKSNMTSIIMSMDVAEKLHFELSATLFFDSVEENEIAK
jgi:hypothetical protein